MTKRSTRSRKSTARRSLDVRSLADVPMFEKLMKKGPKMLVLVYADWCGHCTHFKEGVWNKENLSKIHGANTASVHYNMVENTSMKNANIEGYPTVFEVKPNEEPIALNQPQSGEELVNIGNSGNNTVNSANMNTNSGNTNSANSANMNINNGNNTKNNSTNSANMNTNSGNKNNSANSANMNVNNGNKKNNSAAMNTSAETATEVLSNSGSMNKAANAYSPVPPDALEDVVGNESSANMKQTGGRLYDALLEYTAAAAPAALLLGAAVYRGKRGKKSRATRRKSSKGRKTRSQRK